MKCLVVAGLVSRLWFAGGLAAADEAQAVAPASAQPGAGEAAKPAAASDSLDFDLLPKEAPKDLTAELKLEAEAKVRRSMLQWHQALGIATTLLMVGTVITGQLNYSDRYAGGTSTGRYEIWHTSFEAATLVSFTGTGLLALFAPVPFPKHPRGVDTILIHKIAMFIAAAGFASEIPLGIYTVTQEGHINQGQFALAHLIIGYITAAAFATGVTTLLFP